MSSDSSLEEGEILEDGEIPQEECSSDRVSAARRPSKDQDAEQVIRRS